MINFFLHTDFLFSLSTWWLLNKHLLCVLTEPFGILRLSLAVALGSNCHSISQYELHENSFRRRMSHVLFMHFGVFLLSQTVGKKWTVYTVALNSLVSEVLYRLSIGFWIRFSQMWGLRMQHPPHLTMIKQMHYYYSTYTLRFSYCVR